MTYIDVLIQVCKFQFSSCFHVTLMLHIFGLQSRRELRRCPGHPSRWDGTNRSPERPVRRSWSCSRGMGPFLEALGAQWCPVVDTQRWSFETPELGFQHGSNFNRKQLEWLTFVYIDIYSAWWFVFFFFSCFHILGISSSQLTIETTNQWWRLKNWLRRSSWSSCFL